MSGPVDEEIARLLRETGARPAAPPDRSARVEARVREHWRRAVAARRRAASLRLAAIAATIILSVLAWSWLRRAPSTSDLTAATVERGSATAGNPVAGGLAPGTVVATGSGERISLRTGSRHSVRLDAGSRVRLLSGRSIALESGAVYVDSGGPARTTSTLEVQTPFGVLRDVGTQFEARLSGEALDVRVREGLVGLEHGSTRLTVGTGEALRVNRDGTRPLESEAIFGPGWSWVEEAAPRIAIEGRTLSNFLDWLARERGLGVRFATDELAATAGRTTLSGSIEGMTLDEALQSVLATCGMRHQASASELLIERN